MVLSLSGVIVINLLLAPPVLPPVSVGTSYGDGHGWTLVTMDTLSASRICNEWKDTGDNYEVIGESCPPQMWAMGACKNHEIKAVLHSTERTLGKTQLVSVTLRKEERKLLVDLLKYLKNERNIEICWESIRSDHVLYVSACYVYL